MLKVPNPMNVKKFYKIRACLVRTFLPDLGKYNCIPKHIQKTFAFFICVKASFLSFLGNICINM